MYAVVVTLDLAPGVADDFMPEMMKNARQSLDLEPGCHRFDVLVDPDLPDRVMLYELYTDRAAFDAHLTMPHFHAFDAVAAEMVTDKDIRLFPMVLT